MLMIEATMVEVIITLYSGYYMWISSQIPPALGWQSQAFKDIFFESER